ncbi:MAG: hypothetical protein HQL73_07580 [Magnetococcales bacterium]|nr:hypothetical protein [Magnetococcales bacterium]
MKRLLGVVAGLAVAMGAVAVASAQDQAKMECVKSIDKVIMQKVVKQVEVEEAIEVTNNCCCKAQTRKVVKQVEVMEPTEVHVVVPVEVVGSACLGSEYQKKYVTCEHSRKYNGAKVTVRATCPAPI